MRFLVIALIIAWPSVAAGNDQSCGPQDYSSKSPPNFNCLGPGEAELQVELNPPASIPVRQGQRAEVQWDGALVHRDRLLEVGFRLKTSRRLRWLDQLRLSEEFEVRLRYAQQVAEARLQFAERQRDVYRERLAASERQLKVARSWWASPVLWFAVGMVVTGAIFAVTAYGLDAVGD